MWDLAEISPIGLPMRQSFCVKSVRMVPATRSRVSWNSGFGDCLHLSFVEAADECDEELAADDSSSEVSLL